MWHIAGREGRTDMCRWLKAQGAVDEINVADHEGWIPLMAAIIGSREASLEDGKTITEREETARWMVANGADIKAVANYQYQCTTVFILACEVMSFEFACELADMVPPEHLTLPLELEGHCVCPLMASAMANEQHGVQISSMLILRGVPVPTIAELSLFNPYLISI